MFEPLIDAIQGAVKPFIFTFRDRDYSSQPLYDLPALPMPDSLSLTTLTSLAMLITDNIETFRGEGVFIHVVSPTKVHIRGERNENEKRTLFATAEPCFVSNFRFGQSMPQSTFITAIQTDFVQSAERDRLLTAVAELNVDSSVRLQDNGVNQTTSFKRKAESVIESIQNPFLLEPYRTFNEIEQPTGTYILRIHANEDNTPTVSLHDAGGEVWKLAAIAKIVTFLREQLGEAKTPILA